MSDNGKKDVTSEEREKKISHLLCCIRRCDLCRVRPRYSPCVFGSAGSKVMIISENPPETQYTGRKGGKQLEGGPLGDLMAKGDLVGHRRTPKFCHDDWLKVPDFTPRKFFWIHRANCYDGDHDLCSRKFLERTITLLKPSLILVFGSCAAYYFFPDARNLLELVQRRNLVIERGAFFSKCRVFYHWSPQNRSLQKHWTQQQQALRDARNSEE